MGLHPQAQEVLDLLSGLGLVIDETTDVKAIRESMDSFARAGRARGEAVASVENRTVPGPGGEIAARIYRPSHEPGLPIVVYFHGGGWVIGSLETHDNSCRALANAVDAVVVSVDYRLAPEHRFPAAVDDAFAATQWVADHAAELGGDAERIAVAGDSAGGNLAAVVSVMARETDGPALVFQLLVYPATDGERDCASMRANATGYFLERDSMRWFDDQYLRDERDREDWRFSPLRAESLSGLPPAFVLTAEFDPLCDQGEAYARRLEQAGVPVELRRYDGVFHGFFGMRDLMEPAQQAFDDVTKAMREALTT